MKRLSVAPKERINVKFVPATGDQQEEVELPFKMVILGDFTGRADDTPIEERKTINIDKNNFSSVFKDMGIERDLEVSNVLQEDDPEATLTVRLKFEELQDFAPDSIISQVPELKKMADLREALTALKGPLGNMPAFRNALSELVGDEERRESLLSELSETSEDKA